jgi:outer membrane scaffolding protein for murein synthesis (MipA/OmpV family)
MGCDVDRRAIKLSLQAATRLLGACFLLFVALQPAVANQFVTRTPILDADPGTVGLGFGYRWGDSPYVDIDDVASMKNENSSDLVPLYLYEGKLFFSRGTEAGLHLFDNDVFAVDLLGRYRFDRLEAEASPFFEGIDDRRQTFEGGLAVSVTQPWGILSFSALNDMLGRHDGQAYDLNYRLPIKRGRWTFTPQISLVHQSEGLMDYYYGVDANEATPSRPQYQADSETFWRVGLNTSWEIIDNMYLYANIGWENLPDSVEDSPLTDEDELFSAFAGMSYFFGNTFEPTVANSTATTDGQWSWRFNAGYTAEETFHKVHRGALRRSEDVRTYLTGFTLGRRVKDGERVDFWGRLSINRRLENDLQDDFFEYVAYVMAMGTGYAPWSHRELFRYGFGFGFSYADRVPIIEQVKQQKRGRDTAHFLNYLEAQVDFPLSNFFDTRSNCYIGLTLVHRSGIFATSDILGNVSGGSDVVTGHVECSF